MIIDDIKAAKIRVEKKADNHYLVNLKRPKACPQCKNSLVRKGLRSRSINDLDNEGRPIQASISYPRYYCSQCKKFVDVKAFDDLMPKSKYSEHFKNTLLQEIAANPTKPYIQICKKYGVSKSTVDVWLKSANTDLQNTLCRFEPTENLIICPFTYGSKDCLLFVNVQNNRSRILTILEIDKDSDGAISYFLERITQKWPMPRLIMVGDLCLISKIKPLIIDIAIHRAVVNQSSDTPVSLEYLAAYKHIKVPFVLLNQAIYNMAYTFISDWDKAKKWYSKEQLECMAQEITQQIDGCRDKDPYAVLDNLSKCASRLNDVVWPVQKKLYKELTLWNEYLLPCDFENAVCQTTIDAIKDMYSRGISFDRAVYIMLHNSADEISK